MDSRDKMLIEILVIAVVIVVIIIQRPHIPLVLRRRYGQRPQAPGLSQAIIITTRRHGSSSLSP
ncbi:hypothetical protein MKX07_004746 [Trichoderma sp. CBMAI-0711]|nr:hypothetical protein MKX07_004746 [Trichoderma sp. CBMAI-0711]